MKLVTNLIFKGQCRDAFERYAAIFGGTVKAMIPFATAPAEAMPAAIRASPGIMHAWLDIGDQSLMGCDLPSGQDIGPSGFSASYHGDDVVEAERVFDALAEGGRVGKVFGATFWSPGFGTLTDRFGTPWTINTNGSVA